MPVSSSTASTRQFDSGGTLGEVRVIALTQLWEQLDGRPQEQAIDILTREFHRACGRERYRRTRVLVTAEESLFACGTPTASLFRTPQRTPLDELIDEENYLKLAAKREQLSAREQALLRTLASDVPDDLKLDTLASCEHVHRRTVQRRRKEIVDRLRRKLEG
jgi:hypothetical protein